MKKPATLIAVRYEPNESEHGKYVFYKMFSTSTIQYRIFPKRTLTAHSPVLLYIFKGHPEDLGQTNDANPIASTPNIPFDNTVLLTRIIENKGRCFVEWEENQCDGCRARIPLRKNEFAKSSDVHQKPNDRTDPFGIGCTAHLYDRPKLTDGKITLYL